MAVPDQFQIERWDEFHVVAAFARNIALAAVHELQHRRIPFPLSGSDGDVPQPDRGISQGMGRRSWSDSDQVLGFKMQVRTFRVNFLWH